MCLPEKLVGWLRLEEKPQVHVLYKNDMNKAYLFFLQLQQQLLLTWQWNLEFSF